MEIRVMETFESWFSKTYLTSVEHIDGMIERALSREEWDNARHIIDWMHGRWSWFWNDSGVHITGPYCRISKNGYRCRIKSTEGEEDSKTDDQSPIREA